VTIVLAFQISCLLKNKTCAKKHYEDKISISEVSNTNILLKQSPSIIPIIINIIWPDQLDMPKHKQLNRNVNHNIYIEQIEPLLGIF
jgi:hypothetical protein